MSYISNFSKSNIFIQLMRMLVVSVFVLQAAPSLALETDKRIIGWLEDASINSHALKIKAKIDTGAAVSSLNAKIMRNFKRDGEKWVSFRVKNKAGKSISLERRVTRIVKIKRKLALPIKRPVIELEICIGNVYRELEVNLANRENFDYSLLIGRNYLEDHFVVDSSLTFTTKPACK